MDNKVMNRGREKIDKIVQISSAGEKYLDLGRDGLGN